MPIYEFECTECGHRFDRLQGLSDPKPACSSCQGTRVNRLISLVAGLAGSGSSASGGCGCGGACSCAN
jgi:putative FmdB family regulatory protein